MVYVSPMHRGYVSHSHRSETPGRDPTGTPCPAREIIITDAISKAEEIMRKIEKNYPAK